MASSISFLSFLNVEVHCKYTYINNTFLSLLNDIKISSVRIRFLLYIC